MALQYYFSSEKENGRDTQAKKICQYLNCESHIRFSWLRKTNEWPLIITHSFHVNMALQYYFSSEKENGGDTQAKKFVIILTVKALFVSAGCVQRMRKTNRLLDTLLNCNTLQNCTNAIAKRWRRGRCLYYINLYRTCRFSGYHFSA